MPLPARLEKAGVTTENLRKIFSADKAAQPAKPRSLLEQISSRVKDGVHRTMREARLWWAIDRAYDVPFRQTAHTLVEGLMSRKIDDARVNEIAKDWGLTHLLVPEVDSKGKPCVFPGGERRMKLNLPTFAQIYIPFVQAYSKIRWAKLFSDIDQTPLYKYEPLKLTTANKTKCEIITDRVDTMTTQMGYRSDEKSSIFQMLQYGICLNFPMEKWYSESQEDADGNPEIIREGIRWAIPHPSKTFVDLAHRTSTVNTDTGCEYGGYWNVNRWRDVRLNESYFNTDKVSYGPSDWVSQYWNPYNELYPCQMAFPSIRSPGSSDMDREKQIGIYTDSDDDKATILVPYFGKIVPSEWGLGKYDYPVWHRFVMANTDTMIFAEPLCYRPMVYYGYDADTNRELNAGLGLELLPWQDMLGNYLSQMLYSIKKNLANCIFYNQEIVSEEDIRKINSPGEEVYRGLLFIGRSKRELGWQQNTTGDAFHSIDFPKHNIQEIILGITTMINLMERMLGFSSQEIGQPAAHEQSATEITTIQGNTSVRVDHTRAGVEDGMNARKRSHYDGMMAYSDDEIFAQIGQINDKTRVQLKEMGFEIEEEEDPGHTKAGVRGDKKSLDIDGFAANREGGKRINNIQIASAMIKMFETILAQPTLVQAMGLPQIADMLNLVFTYAGLPREYKVTIKEGAAANMGPDGKPVDQEAQKQDLLKQLEMISQKVATEVVNQSLTQLTEVMKEKVIAPIQQAIQQTQAVVTQQAEKNQQQDEALAKIMQVIQAAMAPPPVPPPMTGPGPMGVIGAPSVPAPPAMGVPIIPGGPLPPTQNQMANV